MKLELGPAVSEQTRRIAALCACPRSSPEQTERLKQALVGYRDGAELLHFATYEGVEGLLRLHLRAVEAEVPGLDGVVLSGLALRQRRAAAAQRQGLESALEALGTAGIRVMLLKGAALAHTIYEQPAHRPMADLDLLVDPGRSAEAQQCLLAAGWALHASIGGRQHEQMLTRSIDGMAVYCEVHHRALWNQPDQVLPALWESGTEVPGLGPARMAEAHTLLWQVFHHAFRSQVYWVPYRLIWVADVIGLLERLGEGIDGPRLWREHPSMARSLPLLDPLCPLPRTAVAALGGAGAVGGVGRVYTGWPRRPLRTEAGLDWEVAGQTLWPGRWWLGLRYGWGSSLPASAVAWVEHLGSLVTHAW